MNEARSTDLQYGHLGEAIFDDESHRWYFTRTPCITRQLNLLGQPTIVVPPSFQESFSTKPQSALERNRQIKALAQLLPEIVPGISLLPELAQTSELVDRITSIHDPAKSTLLSFGKAEVLTGKRSQEKSVPIVAFASGSAGEKVRLIRLRKDQLGWDGDGEVFLRYLTPDDEEQGWWCGNASPIHQLCFAESERGSSSWLAVRYHGVISILNPRLLLRPLPKSPSYSSHLTATQNRQSILDANHTVTLSAEQTGGFPYADLSFNIWNNRQFAVVDQQGGWSIWELENHRLHGGSCTTKAGPSGHITEDLEENPDSTAYKDGWGIILWAGDENTIVVANRRKFSVFHILSNNTKRLFTPDLALSESTDRILDLKRNPSDDTHIFLTTSTRIFWLQIIPGNGDHSEADTDSGAKILLSWWHFRDHDDNSLQMNVLIEGNTTMVVLYSRLTSLCTVFTFQTSTSPPGLPLSISDPFILPLSHELSAASTLIQSSHISAQMPSILNLQLKVVEYDIQDGSMTPGLGNQYNEGGVKFYQLLTLLNDLSLHECLYVGQPIGDSTQIQPPEVQKRRKFHDSPARVREDDFIVPNRVSIQSLEGSSLQPTRPNWNEDKSQNKLASKEDPWTLDFEWLEREIGEHSPRFSRNQGAIGAPLDECLHSIRSAIINKLSYGPPGIESFLQILGEEVLIEDVDVYSTALRDFITSIGDIIVDGKHDNEDPTQNVHRVVEFMTLQMSAALDVCSSVSQELSLSQIYDNLIKLWISPLPTAVPGRVRVAMAKRIRELATQLFLAIYGIRFTPSPLPAENDEIAHEPFHMTDQSFNLPVRRKRSLTILPAKPQQDVLPQRSSSPLASSQISEDTGFLPPSPSLPAPTLPTPEKTPSLRSKSSISPSLATVLDEDPASQRLRTLATLTPQPALPSAASDILHHWSEGANPDTYDWETTQDAIAAGHVHQDDDDDDDDDDEAAKAKLKKRQRLQKRLQRQRAQSLAGSSSQQQPPPPPSSAPMRVRESQPSPARDALGSSQRVGIGVGDRMNQTLGSGSGGGRGKGRKKGKPGFR